MSNYEVMTIERARAIEEHALMEQRNWEIIVQKRRQEALSFQDDLRAAFMERLGLNEDGIAFMQKAHEQQATWGAPAHSAEIKCINDHASHEISSQERHRFNEVLYLLSVDILIEGLAKTGTITRFLTEMAAKGFIGKTDKQAKIEAAHQKKAAEQKLADTLKYEAERRINWVLGSLVGLFILMMASGVLGS